MYINSHKVQTSGCSDGLCCQIYKIILKVKLCMLFRNGSKFIAAVTNLLHCTF